MALLVLPGETFAGSARDYLNAPIDSWITFANTGYVRSVTPEDGLDVSSRVQSNVFSQTFVLTRTMDFGGRTGGLSLVVPYVAMDASIGGTAFSNDGFSDLGFLFQVNLFGGPALTRQQFASFVPQTFSSFHFLMNVPTGKYSSSDVLNPSANRWTFVPTVNYSYTPDEGRTWLEAYFSARLFTTNGEFGPGGASTLNQNPLAQIEGHASRNLTSRLWLSADAYYNVGGETRIDGMSQDNAANTLRLGAGFGFNFRPGGEVIFNYERVVAKPAGQPDSDAFRLKLQQLW